MVPLGRKPKPPTKAILIPFPPMTSVVIARAKLAALIPSDLSRPSSIHLRLEKTSLFNFVPGGEVPLLLRTGDGAGSSLGRRGASLEILIDDRAGPESAGVSTASTWSFDGHRNQGPSSAFRAH